MYWFVWNCIKGSLVLGLICEFFICLIPFDISGFYSSVLEENTAAIKKQQIQFYLKLIVKHCARNSTVSTKCGNVGTIYEGFFVFWPCLLFTATQQLNFTRAEQLQHF